MKYENILNAAKNMPGVEDSLTGEQSSRLDDATQLVKGMSFCVHHGLFKLTMQAGTLMNVNLGIDFGGMPRSMMFGAFALVIAIFFGVVGGILLMIAVAGYQGSYDGKSKVAQRTLIGLILLIIAALAAIVGMGAYTAGSAQSVHNPLMFIATMGQSLSHMFSGQAFGGGRGKRDLNLNGLDVDDATKQMMATMFEGMDPMYGYAFFLGWVAVVVFIAGAIFAAVAKQSLIGQPYSGPSSMKI